MDKIVGGVIALIAIYVLFFYDDGALFSQLTGALGDWFAGVLERSIEQ